MKSRQNVRHFASRKALETPGVRAVASAGLVRLHTRVFTRKADPEHAAEREAHLDALFEGTIDAYLEALRAGYSEAEAREITHVQANFDFFNHGWTEMMEIPGEELEDHYRRYEEFFTTHGITIDEPLGEFRPVEGITAAPETPAKLETAEYENAIAGFADDVYVETEEGDTVAGGDTEEPEDVDPAAAPGLDEDEASA